MEVYEIVGALVYLEKRKGTHPSTKEIAEQAGCAEATGIKYLQIAVARNIIVQREGHYMTHEVARAFDAKKEVEIEK